MSSVYVEEDLRGVTFVPLTPGVGGPNQLMAAEPGKRHKIVGGMLSFSANGTLDLLSGVTSLFGGAMAFGEFGGFLAAGDRVFLQTNIGEALNMTTTGAAPRGFFKVVTE